MKWRTSETIPADGKFIVMSRGPANWDETVCTIEMSPHHSAVHRANLLRYVVAWMPWVPYEVDRTWYPIETAPKTGKVIDVMFDPTTAEIDGTGKNMAEFYAPGCTRKRKPTPPIIEGVRFDRGYFRPAPDCYAILSVTLTRWRNRLD